MKVWKRCAAALLAFIMMFTSAHVGFAAGRLDGETNIWSASAADIVAERYGLASNAKLAAVLCNEAVNTGAAYAVEAPYANGTEGKQDLIAVDYREKMFYVSSYESEGFIWIPTEAVLFAEGEEKESFDLTESVCYYNNVEYYAVEAFTYTGKAYTIEVTYELAVQIDAAEQQRILEIPLHLGQAVKNVEKTLSGMWYDLYTFEQMVPALHRMLSMSLPAAKEGEPAEPFFNSEKHAAEIAAINGLYEEYMKTPDEPQLDMFAVCDESLRTKESGLVYAMNSGEKVRETAATLYEKVDVLAKSQRLNSLCSQLKNIDAELNAELKNMYRYLDRFVGSATKEGSLQLLKEDANWSILDSAVQASIFKEGYTAAELDMLGAVASGLRNVTYAVPEVDTAPITTAQVAIACQIVTHDVTVSVSAKVVKDGVGVSDLKELSADPVTIRMLDGATQEELDAAIRATGLEESALLHWNSANGAYKISGGNYQRMQNLLDGVLAGDFVYEISYEPNYYTVDTNYGSKLRVPFGYQIDLPVCAEEDGWYDYRVTFANGNTVSYDEGAIFAVESDMEIARITGAAKFEYRILDYLADDSQYAMSDAEKKILYNTAINSPVVRIRIPGENISEIIDAEGGFYVEAKDLASGMQGMTWNIDSVTLYDGADRVQDVQVGGGKAAWETAGFTHVVANHRMQVTRVRDGFFSRELTAAEIAEYANLPHVLVGEIAEQDRVLRGTEGVTAKTMLDQMKSREGIMGLLPNFGELMQTTEGKNAILRLSGSESGSVKGVNGESLGYGGWSATSDEPAIYKYLKLCESADWSVATYYQKGYYNHLAKQSMLMADCLEIIVEDPGFVEVLDIFDMTEKAEEIKEMIPELRELSEMMKGPNRHLDVNHSQLSVLVADVLAAEGKTKEYKNATTLFAYSVIRRNGENSGSLQVTVQIQNVEKTMSIDYELETVDGSERYHVMTAGEAAKLQQFIATSEASCGLTEAEKRFYDVSGGGYIPGEKDHLGRGEKISLIYTPKTYTVTVSGERASEILTSFQYGGSYVIDLPAKSDKSTDKKYYEYTLLDEKGEVLSVVSVENGSTGHFTFKKAQLPNLFPTGGYTIYRTERKATGEPEFVFKPKLSAELIRGAEVDAKNKMLYLDAVPTGITAVAVMEQLKPQVENGQMTDISLCAADGFALGSEELVGTGSILCYEMEDVFKNKIADSYTIIMMGDVNGDGLCNDADIDEIVGIYFLETDKKGNYIDPFPLDPSATLAANMNNNKKVDSNDAWTIRSKSLYWDGDKKQNQIVYRSVL